MIHNGKEYFWHFSGENDKGKPCLAYDDGRLIKRGITHKIKGDPVLCERGLHASRNLMDALQYAPGNWISLCSLSGTIIHGDDKSVATERTYLFVVNAEPVMREFARWAALQVCHLWDCPPVSKQYLETGDESIRDAAWAASRAAARDAARAAARDAVWDAAWDAARDAAWAAAWDAARDAAWDAARAAAWDAARAAARDAARDAARAAARAAAWYAARDAAWDAQEKRFTEMVLSIAPKGWDK